MKAIDARRLQEGVSDLILSIDEITKASYAVYKSHINAGFTKKQAMELTKYLIKPGE